MSGEGARAIAWDVDGTLVDSEPLHLRALLASCAEHGVDVSDLPDPAFVGVHLDDVWVALAERFPATLSKDRWRDELNDYYHAHAHSLALMPGAREVVARFAGQGLAQGAVSNSHRAVVDANLRATGLEQWMAFSVSFDDVAHGKPSPEPYRQALRRMALQPAAVLAVEDSNTGLQSARAAGLVTVGYAPNGEALVGADFLIRHLEELLDLVRPWA